MLKFIRNIICFYIFILWLEFVVRNFFYDKIIFILWDILVDKNLEGYIIYFKNN